MAPLWAAAKRSSYTLVAAHVFLWLLGAGGILLVALRLRRSEIERMRMAEELLKVQKLESLGILAGGIAHDYNNLLTCIMGNISFATQIEDEEIRVYKEKPAGVVLECLIDAEKATLRARDLTKQLTTFSKGGIPVKALVPDIGELIRESVDFALRGSNVKCEYSLPDGLFSVEADRGQITQVLDNIVINADQAMPTGGLLSVGAENLTIEARGKLPLKPGIYLKITIKDQGAGIPEENRSKVFDPYFTTKEAGSGLGLATAYSIIKKHGGHISLESEVKAGSAFSIYLPASGKKAVIKKAEEAVSARAIKEGEGRILVMDDDELVSGVARRILSKSGYEVASARHGNEAIDLYTDARARGRAFDLLILDLTVPGEMGGAETIKKLLEIDPRVKAIVSSGYSDDPVIEDFKKYGFKGVVVKPYAIAELRRVVREVLASDEE
jgi:signal transduction histidine kinase/CheY-like chemotaxis protein